MCMELMSLKSMCELLNVSRRIIQSYERGGLLKPTGKNKYGYLLYDEKEFHRAEKIRLMQLLGFKLREIKVLIDEPITEQKRAIERRIRELEDYQNEIIRKARTYLDNMN